jgi:hypothetical protein
MYNTVGNQHIPMTFMTLVLICRWPFVSVAVFQDNARFEVSTPPLLMYKYSLWVRGYFDTDAK